MNNKKIIRLFIIVMCLSSGEAFATKSLSNNNDLFLNKSDIPKIPTTPPQEGLDNLNKKLQQEAANHYQQNLKPKPRSSDTPTTFRTPYQEAVNNYNKQAKPNSHPDRNNRNDFFNDNDHRNRIEIPLPSLEW